MLTEVIGQQWPSRLKDRPQREPLARMLKLRRMALKDLNSSLDPVRIHEPLHRAGVRLKQRREWRQRVFDMPLKRRTRQAAHCGLPAHLLLLQGFTWVAVERAEDGRLGVEPGEVLLRLASELLLTELLPVLERRKEPLPEHPLVLGRDLRDRGRQLEGLLEKEMTKRPTRIDAHFHIVAIDLSVGVVEPVPIGRNNKRDGGVPEDRLHTLQQVDNVVGAAAVEVVDEDRDGAVDIADEPVEATLERVHRVARLPDKGLSASLGAASDRTHQAMEAAHSRDHTGDRPGEKPDRIAACEVSGPDQQAQDCQGQGDDGNLRLRQLEAPPERAEAEAEA